MYYDPCNGNATANPQIPCDDLINEEFTIKGESEWPLERVVSTVVPVFFGIIGLAGLLGNALVVIGKTPDYPHYYSCNNNTTKKKKWATYFT